MECHGCREEKLLNEYPRENLTNTCDHPYHFCFECVIRELKATKKCPECRVTVRNHAEKVKLYEAHLKRLFKHYKRARPDPTDAPDADDVIHVIHVRRLDGEEKDFLFKSDMTIKELKEKIKAHWKYAEGKQCLKYNKRELEVYDRGRYRTFKDFDVKGGSTIHLIIRLLSVPDNIDHAIFELNWHYPKTSKKNLFIDASCFVYKGSELYKVVDFENDVSCNGSIKHSGDDMNRIERIGHHCIEVKLKQIPNDVTHLYFLLSTWNAPNIADNFDNVLLQFCEADNIFAPLCNTELPPLSLREKSVIVCYAKRGKNCWDIDEVKKPCKGNVDAYEPMKQAVRELIENL